MKWGSTESTMSSEISQSIQRNIHEQETAASELVSEQLRVLNTGVSREENKNGKKWNKHQFNGKHG